MKKIDSYNKENIKYLYNAIDQLIYADEDEMGHYMLYKKCGDNCGNDRYEKCDKCEVLNETLFTMNMYRMKNNSKDEYYHRANDFICLRPIGNHKSSQKLWKCEFEFRKGTINDQIIELLKRFDGESTIFYLQDSDLIIYDLVNNIGLVYDMKMNHWKLFVLDMNMNVKKVSKYYGDRRKKDFQISGSVINLSDNHSDKKEDFNTEYSKAYKVFFYYSDDSCEWREKHETGRVKFLSSYGNKPKYLGLLFEYIARDNLNIEVDEKYGYSHNDYEYSSCYSTDSD
jgi:hypothetical protein